MGTENGYITANIKTRNSPASGNLHAILLVLRYLLVILTVCSCLFIIYVYIDWGLWDASWYLQRTDCTEEVFNFQTPYTCDVGLDADLFDRCNLYNKILARAKQHKVIQQDGRIVVKTKCGYVIPKLISYERRSSKRNRTVSLRTQHRPRLKDWNRQNRTKHTYLVPNVVHYISFGDVEFSFLNYLSVLSVHKFINPVVILLHGDRLPRGFWWRKTLAEVPRLYHVTRERPIRIQGKRVPWVEHSSDILRLQTLRDNGGIYLDLDVMVLKSFDPLRHHEVTLGRESYYGLGNSIIIAEPNSPFLCLWMEVYHSYRPFPWNWAPFAVWTPHIWSTLLPGHVHVEEENLLRPTWQEAELLYKKPFDWSNSYSIHVWRRYMSVEVPRGPNKIRELDTTLGEVMRFIYFGKKEKFH